MGLEVCGWFVSEKVSCVLWAREQYAEPRGFLSGGWDGGPEGGPGAVRAWRLEGEEEARAPRPVSARRLLGDVTALRWLEAADGAGGALAAASSVGEVRVLELSAYDAEAPLAERNVWSDLHHVRNESCSCTALTTLDGEITTVGEDGRINVLNCRRNDPVRTIHQADSCSLHCVCYIKYNEIITGNLRGHMKIWDLRSSSDKPTAAFLLSGEQFCATCIAHHPNQHHMILAGNEGGSLALWDLRMNSYPASLINAHSAAVTDMQFHPDNPQKLITCSASGDLFDWNMDIMIKSASSIMNESEAQNASTWMATPDNKNSMMVSPLMPNLHKPINSLDCSKGRVLCGADNEAVYLVNNVNF